MALILLLLLLPLMGLLSLAVWVFSGRPVFFKQKRRGKKGTDFWIYKFRTMRRGAEEEQKGLGRLNEVSGPVFKIRNDPRFTGVGKFLSHCGADELPQLVNVIKGEMALVGPRPLPVSEAEKIEDNYRGARESVLPGIISPWIFGGYHQMKFDQWMTSDVEYVTNKSVWKDLIILARGGFLLVKLVTKELIGLLT